jgi:hypothetical protein
LFFFSICVRTRAVSFIGHLHTPGVLSKSDFFVWFSASIVIAVYVAGESQFLKVVIPPRSKREVMVIELVKVSRPQIAPI